MSATPTHTNGTNGTTPRKLTSFVELGALLDLGAFPDSPSPSASSHAEQEAPAAQPSIASPEAAPATVPFSSADLAELIRELANMSGGLESMAREDARNREQATIELARYEALLAERKDAERGLTEARRVRAAAEALAVEAFSEEARVRAAQHVSGSRQLELRCVEMLAQRTREVQELASRPQLSRVLAERRRLAETRREAARAAESERASRLAHGLEALDAALKADELEQAGELLEPLVREFADNSDLRRKQDILRWRLRNRLVAPIEATLHEISRRAYRQDAEAALARLAGLRTDGLPEDLARRVFGVWSNTCWHVVQLRGMTDPRRETPGTSRGAIWARTPGGAYEVVSSLGHPAWQPGQVVPDRIARNAPALRAPASNQNRTNDGA